MYMGGRLGPGAGRQSGRFSDFDRLSHNSDRLYRPGYSVRSSRASSVYTDVPSDPVILRRVLEENFRPLFQGFVYGGEQITNNELRQHLLEDSYRRLIPRSKLYAVMDLVDYNPSKSITYNAFVRLILGEDTGDDRLGGSESGSMHSLDEPGVLYTIVRNTAEPQDLLKFTSIYNWRPPPFFIILLSLAQIIVFAVYASELSDQGTPVTAMDGVPAHSKIIYNPARRYEVWRFLSYTFLHQGYVDLLLTLVLQLFICLPIEIVFYFWRIAILYIIGTLAGSLMHSISDHKTALVGGSGGTYCILAAHFVAMMYKWSELRKVDDGPIKRVFCHPAFRMAVIILLAVIQISLAVYRRFFAPDVFPIGIGHFGGGLFAGIMLSEAFLKERDRYPWQTNAGIMNFFMFLIFAGGCGVFNFLYKGYPPSDYS